MPRRIVIIGGLASTRDPAAVLSRLREQTKEDVEWEWICAAPYSYNLDRKQRQQFNRLIHQLRTGNETADTLIVIELKCLHRRVSGELRSATSDPKLAPKGLATEDELVAWLFAADTGLFPPRKWYGNVLEAALLAILGKLLGNKSINKDQRGHNWTKEEDLLNQSPVMRPQFPEVRNEAMALLGPFKGNLLLSKGSGQGNTPKEWCVNIRFLPKVKKAIAGCSLKPLAECSELAATLQRIRDDSNRPFRIDGPIISPKIFLFCQDGR